MTCLPAGAQCPLVAPALCVLIPVLSFDAVSEAHRQSGTGSRCTPNHPPSTLVTGAVSRWENCARSGHSNICLVEKHLLAGPGRLNSGVDESGERPEQYVPYDCTVVGVGEDD